MTNTLPECLDAGGSEEQEAAARIRELEVESERRRRLLEISDERAARLSEKADALEAQLAEANARADDVLKAYEDIRRSNDSLRHTINQRWERAARLEEALEIYANETNWIENADWPVPHWMWIGTQPIPARIAQEALRPAPAQPEESEGE